MTEPESNTALGGYSCLQCGQWVPYGVVHQCSGSWRFVSTVPPVMVSDVWERIAAALERIVAVMEKQ